MIDHKNVIVEEGDLFAVMHIYNKFLSYKKGNPNFFVNAI